MRTNDYFSGMAAELHARRDAEREGERLLHAFHREVARRPYSRAIVRENRAQEGWIIRYEHAGERRTFTTDPVILRGMDNATEFWAHTFARVLFDLDYLDSLRQGMRDLIDP